MASSTSTSPVASQSSKKMTGTALSIVGLILILLAAGDIVYDKYVLHTHFHLLVFHPIIYPVGILGIILLIVGLYFYASR
jgi:uncharacterized membrane protein